MGRNCDTISISSKKPDDKVEENEKVSEVEVKVKESAKVEEETLSTTTTKKPEEAKKRMNEKPKRTQIPVFLNSRDMARNPITGVGLEADTDRPRKNQCKKG